MSNPRTIDDILADYIKTERLSKQNVEGFPLPARPSVEVQVKQSTAKLPKIRLEYLTRILKSSFGFFVEGDDDAKNRQFIDIAIANGAVLVDADAIFQKLANEIQSTIGPSKQFSVTQVGLMDNTLRDLVEATGYDGTLNRTNIADLRVVNTREKLVSYIRELVARSNGSTPVTVTAQNDIVTQALKQKFTGKNLVVVVCNAVASNRAALSGLFKKVTRVDTDTADKVDETWASEVFREGIQGKKAPMPPAPPPAHAD